ncbi:asparaginase [Pelagibius sp. Alg239-R121]|uniref:asparaginase n=1 Tax=Pelagibius sp. Alg239-R121 TaxID=2993448 RepID=UPI0024A714A4|nr:asparaginase [Pelagibius sp. Alg239-R121]
MGERKDRPKVIVIGTGGTISFDGRHGLDTYEYMEFGTRHDIDTVLTRFPELDAIAQIETVSFRTLSSAAVSPCDWIDLVQKIHDLAEGGGGPDGFVITHGTATLEETAYFLNLTLKTSIPVVLVGAQRPKNALGSDAGPNLVNAVQVAASPEARALGVLVVLNEEIQAAREVTKTSTHRLETFRSPDLGMLGYADADGRVAIYRRPARRYAPDCEFDVSGRDGLPRVDIAATYAGADEAAISAFVAAGARGIVMSSVAPGLVTPQQRDALIAARSEGVVIVESTRAGSGRVLRRTSMHEQGIVAADNLNPQKARVLTMLALTVTDDPERIQVMFELY